MKQNIWYSIARLMVAGNTGNVSLFVDEIERMEYVFDKDERICNAVNNGYCLHFTPRGIVTQEDGINTYGPIIERKPYAERFKNLVKA